MEDSLNKALLALILVIALVFGLFAAIPKSQDAGLTRDQALSTVMQDVYQDTPQDADVRVISESREGGNWFFSVLITRDPHSACPSLQLRGYSLLPVRYRPEELIRDCKANLPIFYREEALIRAAEGNSFAKGAYGCAFHLPTFNSADASAYCAKFNQAEFDAFVENAPETAEWVVQFTQGEDTRFVALSKQGAVQE